MKVVLLHTEFREYTMSLANALADCVDLVVIHPEKMFEQCAPVADARLAIRPFFKPRLRSVSNIPATRKLMGMIEKEKPDLVHLQANGEFWLELALLLGSFPPLVTTVHDIFPHQGDRWSFSIPGSKYTARIPYFRSQQLIVHTHAQKRDLTEKLRVKAERVNVVAMGECGTIYQRWANSEREPVARELYTLLFFGRIWPYKGLRYLIEAMPLVARQFPQIKLVIAGRGEDLRTYFPNGVDATRFEIRDGFIPNQEVFAIFQRCAAVVLPYTEASQSAVAAIAYGAGTPVIASNVGGLTEMVRDGEDGLLVPPRDTPALADAIIRLLSDPGLQQRIQAAAKQRCTTDLNWSNIARETVNVYGKVLGKV